MSSIEERLAKVEKWIENEEYERRRKKRLDEILNADPMFNISPFIQDIRGKVREKVEAARKQVDEELG